MKNTNLTFGEVQSMYFDAEALRLPPVQLYRLDVKGSRHYFTMDDDDEPEFYSGVTSITSATIPKAEQLVKWIADMGYDAAIAYRDERAAYGTLLHTLIASYLIDGKIDLELLASMTEVYLQRENLATRGYNVFKWSEDLKQDMIAFAQFVVDYDVKPLAIEISLASKVNKFAGTTDMPCLMTVPVKADWGEVYASGKNKGEPKLTTKDVRVVAIVDFKSGRKSYGGDEGAAAQLKLYEWLVRENFPEIIELGAEPNMRLYNWSPKDWKTAPSYHLAEQTNKCTDEQLEVMLQWNRVRTTDIGSKTKVFYKGELTVGVEPTENYTVKTSAQLAHERITDESELPTELDGRKWEYLTVGDLLNEIYPH